MSKYIVYSQNKEILRTGCAPIGMVAMQAGPGEYVIEGTAHDRTQKMEFDGLDDSGRPINPRLVDKTPEEIERDNPTPPEIPESDMPADITKGQLQAILERLGRVEDLR